MLNAWLPPSEARLLADSGVQTIAFRASIVIGSGSLSFEMLRKLVERLPVMNAADFLATRQVAREIAARAEPTQVDDST